MVVTLFCGVVLRLRHHQSGVLEKLSSPISGMSEKSISSSRIESIRFQSVSDLRVKSLLLTLDCLSQADDKEFSDKLPVQFGVSPCAFRRAQEDAPTLQARGLRASNIVGWAQLHRAHQNRL